jgi:hypothetical protein
MKTFVIFGMLIGSYAGSFVPLLWGESALSMSSLLFSGIGGILGIWFSYKIAVKYL